VGLRTQVSLQFSDQAMFDNFIKPRREERTLNSLVVRCLTAYYNNPEVRALIDDDVVDVQSTEDIISNIRNFVTTQDILVSSLEDTLSDGMSDFNDVLNKANKKAEDSGVTSENAAEVLKPRLPTKSDGESVTLQSNQVSAIFDALAILASAIGSKDALELIDSNRGGIPRLTSTSTPPKELEEMHEPVPEVEVPQPEIIPDVPVPEPEPAPEVEVPQPEIIPDAPKQEFEPVEERVSVPEIPLAQVLPEPEPEPEPEPVLPEVEPVESRDNDARNAMMDLLGSL